MRPANKHERHQIDRRHQQREEYARPAKMPSYHQWLRRQTMSGVLPRMNPNSFFINPDNLTGE